MNAPFDDQYIQQLAHKWKQGTLTEKEKADFLSWYNQHDDEFLELEDTYAQDKEQLQQRIFTAINSRIDSSPAYKTLSRRRQWIRYVAAASIIAVVGILVYTFTNRPSAPQVITTAISPNEVSPGSSKAILQLSNGQQINLLSTGNSSINEEGNISILNREDGSLIYSDDLTNANTNTSNILITPKGGQYHITLPDGSQVWLNADSRLDYPVSFKGQKQRAVVLKGEAYFQVAKDHTHPFIVKTDDQAVTVLGTHFNINSYKDEGRTVTTLEEGSVRVSAGARSITIRPGEQTILNGNGALKASKGNIDAALGWRRNEMVFKDATIEEVMRQIARWYDLQVEYRGKTTSDTFTGTLDRTANLDTILRMLATIQLHFTLEQTSAGKKLVIKP